MNIVNFPTPTQTNQELLREIAELSTLLEHQLAQVSDEAGLDAPRALPARDFYVLARLLLLTRLQNDQRMLAICARLGVQS